MLHIYTETLGRVSAMAKGGRRSRRRFPGALEILTQLEVRLIDRPRSALMRLEAARVTQPFEGLVNHLGRYAIACQFVELLDRFTGEREPNPELFRFASGLLQVVTHEVPDRLLGLLVVVKTLARLGYRPQLSSCSVCGGEIALRGGRIGFEPRHGGAVCGDCCGADAPQVSARLLLALESGIRSPLRARAQLGFPTGGVRRAEFLVDRFLRFHLGAELRTAQFSRDMLPVDVLDGELSPGNTAPERERATTQ